MTLIHHARLSAIAILLLLLPFEAFTQKKKLKKKAQANTQTIWLAHNPLTWVEPEVPVTVTILYKYNKKLAFALDAGLFVARQDYSGGDANFKPYSGFRIKPEVKFYPNGEKNGPTGFYLSMQGLIKSTGWKKEEWRTPNNQNGFQQLVNYTEKKSVLGLNFLAGSEFLMDKQERWMLEIYAGIGIRNKHFEAIGLPSGFSNNYDRRDDVFNRSFNIYRNGLYYSIALGFKLGVRIK